MPYNVINKAACVCDNLKIRSVWESPSSISTHFTTQLALMTLISGTGSVSVMMSQWPYKHDSKTKDFVAYVSTLSISLWHDKQLGSNFEDIANASVNQNKD